MRYAILTIDDSPNENTLNFASYLAEQHISAVFFCIGKNIEEHLNTSEQIINFGHDIGNHSYSHKNFSKISFDECIEEINKTEDVINKIYRSVGIKRKKRYFRFPYGNKGEINKSKIQKYLKSCGFEKIDLGLDIEYLWYHENGLNDDVDIFWTFDCEDYRISSIDKPFGLNDVFEHINEKSPCLGGSLVSGIGPEIILIHDHLKTHAMFPEYYKSIISRIKEKGIRFRDSNQ